MNNQEWFQIATNLSEDLDLSSEIIIDDSKFNYEFEEGGSGAESELLNKSNRRPLLFDYQKEIVDQVLATSPLETGLLALPTGAGKTRTALAVCLEGIANNSLKTIIWLATTMELIDQAFETTKSLYENHGGINEIFLSKKLEDFPVDHELRRVPTIIFVTPQAIYANSRKRNRPSLRPDLVVFDEAHQAVAETYKDAIQHLGCLDSDIPTPLLGLSATPGRTKITETESLVQMFNERLLTAPSLGHNPIVALEKKRILSKIEFKMIPTKNMPSKENVRRRLELIYRLTKKLINQKKRPLIFAPSVDAAIALSAVFKATGIKSEAIHSRLEMHDRRQYINDFATRNLDVLTNERILATGYDCPAVSDVIFGAEVGSPIHFEQMVGRACRGSKTGGSARSTVWQFEDHLQLHGLPQSYRRYEDFRWD